MIRLDGRVAIVTGAGRGMGRTHALMLAARGAAVLVNDYGGGQSTIAPGTIDPAEAVAREIRAAGGQAVADAAMVGRGRGPQRSSRMRWTRSVGSTYWSIMPADH